MKFREIKSIQLTLMKKNSEIDENNKAEYISCSTAKFTIPFDFFQDPNDDELLLELLIKKMFNDLIKKSQHLDTNYLGIWIKSDDRTIDNAMSLENLQAIKRYSNQDINPQFEFFKMTLENG